jgi:aconitate hydratase
VAMAGYAFELECPSVRACRAGERAPRMGERKDVILEMLRRLSVKGGINKAFAFRRPGRAHPVGHRAGHDSRHDPGAGRHRGRLPCGRAMRAFLDSQQRSDDFRELLPDPGAPTTRRWFIDLATLEPLIALPSEPRQGRAVREVAGRRSRRSAWDRA